MLKDGNKGDRIDGRKLADLLRGNYLKPVYHGEHGLRMLKELLEEPTHIVPPLAGLKCMSEKRRRELAGRLQPSREASERGYNPPRVRPLLRPHP